MQFFFLRGLTWSRRSQRGLSLRILPEGAIFGDKGPAILGETSHLYSLLGLTNSMAFHSLVKLQMAFGSYEAGVLQRTPIPSLNETTGKRLGDLAKSCVDIKRSLDTANELSHCFLVPALLQVSGDTVSARSEEWQQRLSASEKQLAENQSRINECAFELYGLDRDDRDALQEASDLKTADEQLSKDAAVEESDEETETEQESNTAHQRTKELVSYLVGCVLGRWDVRLVTGDRCVPVLSDPFEALPICSPGMVHGSDGLPASQVPKGYPVSSWLAIIPDDADHSDDIVRRVREVLELIWKDRAEAIEKEACDILGVKELRDYFRKPGKGGFWDDHVSRYSKSRRKAPIYWLLQSSKKNYALWLYYHRLDKDILFKARQNYVDPKIRLEQSRLDSLRSQKTAQGAAGKGAKKIDKDIERQAALLVELKDFAEKLERAAKLNFGNPQKLNSDVVYEPDLNDGVVLTVAPLWELVPWKEAKSYWEELLDGKYEWSSMGKLLRKKGLVK
jgi:hypothetical protein